MIVQTEPLIYSSTERLTISLAASSASSVTSGLSFAIEQAGPLILRIQEGLFIRFGEQLKAHHTRFGRFVRLERTRFMLILGSSVLLGLYLHLGSNLDMINF